jgi:hypothetical protein
VLRGSRHHPVELVEPAGWVRHFASQGRR